MSDPRTFFAFGAIMVVVAMLAIAVDWFGKPMRHRKFVPKIYRFPEERTPRGSSVRPTEWSDRSFVLPVSAGPEVPRHPVGVAPIDRFDQHRPDWPEVPVVTSVFAVDDASPPTAALAAVECPLESTVEAVTPFHDRREQGWAPGAFVFNLTDDGREPSLAVVRERYWRNVAATAGATMFGVDNVERMSVGRPPRRRNPRTGRIETMTLPTASHHDMGGRTPVPAWPGDELDPFAG